VFACDESSSAPVLAPQMRSLNPRRVGACACRATNTPEPARIQVEGCNALILKAVFFAHTSGSAFFSGVAIVVVVGFFLPLHFFRVSLSLRAITSRWSYSLRLPRFAHSRTTSYDELLNSYEAKKLLPLAFFALKASLILNGKSRSRACCLRSSAMLIGWNRAN
jgi:hypothetical protein